MTTSQTKGRAELYEYLCPEMPSIGPDVCAPLWVKLLKGKFVHVRVCVRGHAAACSGRWREDPDHKQTTLSRDQNMTKYWLELQSHMHNNPGLWITLK